MSLKKISSTRVGVAIAAVLILFGGMVAVAQQIGREKSEASERVAVRVPPEWAPVPLPAPVLNAPPDVEPIPEPAPPASLSPPLGAPGTEWERVPHVDKPDAVRAIYVNAWAAGADAKMAELIALADSTEINAFVIDVKDATGYVSYPTTVPLARRIGADEQIRIPDIRELLAKLRAHDIYPIARIVAFKDPLLAQTRRDLAIRTADGTVWRDQDGHIWVDSFNKRVWDYLIALAREAIALGFSEIQWDYVRFPDAPQRYLESAIWPARDGRTKAQAIQQFIAYSQEQLASMPIDVPVTADVFGVTASAPGGVGIGQDWDMLTRTADVLLPMVYPSHYWDGAFGIDYPNARPYAVVRHAMEDAVQRTPEDGALIRPWLQDFTLGPPEYGPAYVRAQIEAVYDAGLSEWVLWNAASNYTAAALAPEHGPAPEFPLPREFAPWPPESDTVPLGTAAGDGR